MSVFQCSISHCCVQLHSCSHLVLLIPLGLQKCLDSPLLYPAFPLIPCSLPTLLTLFFPSLLSKLLGLCCTNPESCFEVLDLVWVDGEALRGKGKELPPEWGTGSLAVEGEGQWEIETASKGAFKRSVCPPISFLLRWAPASAFLGAPAHIQSSLCSGKGGGHRLSLPGDFLSHCRL